MINGQPIRRIRKSMCTLASSSEVAVDNSSLASLELHLPQPQRIRDHRHRAEAHGCRRNDGAQQQTEEWIQHACRNGHAQGVVDEGKEQVLADVAHGGSAELARAHDSAEIGFDQSYAAAFHCNVSASAHGNSDVSLRQRGPVVDAIAGHGDDVSFLLQALDDLRLLVRQYFGFKIVDAQLTGDCFRSGAAVAGEHNNPNALRLELADGLGSRWFDRIGDSDQAGRGTIDSYKNQCLPGAAEIIGFLGKFAKGYTKFFKKLFVPSGNSLALHVSNNALARQITKAAGIDKRESILLRG